MAMPTEAQPATAFAGSLHNPAPVATAPGSTASAATPSASVVASGAAAPPPAAGRFRVLKPARVRVRSAPRDTASTLGFKDVGSEFEGTCVDNWVRLHTEVGFVRWCWEDGQHLLERIDSEANMDAG